MKSWKIYGCKIVEPAEGEQTVRRLPKAILIDRENSIKEAVGLPRGFTTKVLLDYDFSDDDQVLGFVRGYGPVMSPYGGAVDRTLAAIEDPVTYRRLLYSVVRDREEEDRGREERRDTGVFARLFGRVRRPDGASVFREGGPLDPSEEFKGCDYMWDAKRLFYSGMNASAESDYLRMAHRGFVRYLEDDDKLVGTERLRALAWNRAARVHGETGEWLAPQCLISLEEVRAVLYLLQVSAVVMQGFSYLDGTISERRNTGAQRRRYVNRFLPGSYDKDDDVSRIEAAANRTANMQGKIRLVERLFWLFISGRPHLIRAFREVRPGCLQSFRDPDGRPWVPDGILSEGERDRVARCLDDARERFSDDSEALSLLVMRPVWQAWDGLQGDLSVFLTACLTSCWSSGGHHLVENGVLQVGGFEDGGPFFGLGADRMTLQRAIAGQILENLGIADRDLHASGKNAEAPGGDGEPVWKVCSECGNLFIFRSTSRKPILLGEERATKRKMPTATTCSDACRMTEKRRK